MLLAKVAIQHSNSLSNDNVVVLGGTPDVSHQTSSAELLDQQVKVSWWAEINVQPSVGQPVLLLYSIITICDSKQANTTARVPRAKTECIL